MPERSEGGWVLQRSFNPPVQNPHKKIGAASAAPPSRSPRSSRPPRNLEKESIGACRFEANPEYRSCLKPHYLANDTEKPRPKDRGNPIVTVTIHRRRDCGLNMQGRSCRIPEVADQCHVVWELCNSGISCLSTGVFIFLIFSCAQWSFEKINWIHPSARFDRYCTFRFVRNFTRALSRGSDYIVQK